MSLLQSCVSTLAIRHMAMGNGPIKNLSDLRAPMSDVLGNVSAQLAELQRYKARFGELDTRADGPAATDRDEEFELIDNSDEEDEDEVEGSDTEQE